MTGGCRRCNYHGDWVFMNRGIGFHLPRNQPDSNGKSIEDLPAMFDDTASGTSIFPVFLVELFPFLLVDSQFFCWWTHFQKTCPSLLVKTCQNPMFVAKNQMCSMRCPRSTFTPLFCREFLSFPCPKKSSDTTPLRCRQSVAVVHPGIEGYKLRF